MSILLLLIFSSSLSIAHPTRFYALSLHDALPISVHGAALGDPGERRSAPGSHRLAGARRCEPGADRRSRSEEHTSELQSHSDLVCRLLLEKKKTKITIN